MSETPPTPDQKSAVYTEAHQQQGQHAALLSAVTTSRVWLEHTRQEEGVSEEELQEAKLRLAEARTRLSAFENQHGLAPTYGRPSFTRYMPPELGLDTENPDDLQLYVESGGIREVGELLLEKRKLSQALNEGQLDLEAYYDYHGRFDNEIAELRLRYETEGEP